MKVKRLNEKKKILYVVTSGVDTPERTYAPFILATTAVAMGIEATIYFLIKGITLMKRGEAENIKPNSALFPLCAFRDDPTTDYSLQTDLQHHQRS